MKKISLLLLVLLLTHSAYAIECYYDDSPYIRLETRPIAICTIDNDANNRCLTFLSNPENSSEEWGVMPDVSVIVDINKDGVSAEKLSYYPVIDNVVTVGFSVENLYADKKATGNVWCGNETFSFNFTPQYVDYAQIGNYAINTKENASYLIFGILAVIVIIVVGAYIWEQRK